MKNNRKYISLRLSIDENEYNKFVENTDRNGYHRNSFFERVIKQYNEYAENMDIIGDVVASVTDDPDELPF